MVLTSAFASVLAVSDWSMCSSSPFIARCKCSARPASARAPKVLVIDDGSRSPNPFAKLRAVFTSSVILTSGVLHALRERRLRWPDDIAIVGFGDAAWAPVVTPPLTVIEQPARQLGEVAARLLLADGGRERVGQRVVLDAQLILRESHWRPTPALPGGTR